MNCEKCNKLRAYCQTFGDVVLSKSGYTPCKDSATANAITLGEWEAAYRRFAAETHAVRPVTIKVEMSHLHTFMSRTGLSAVDSMAMIDRSTVQSFFGSASDLQPVTRKSIVDGLKKMTSERFREWAKSKGIVLADMPSSKGFGGGYERYKQISDESMKRLRDVQWEYRQSEDPRKWIVLTLSLDYGMSKADVLRATWSDLFDVENGVPVVSYCRAKTGKRAMWKISDEHQRDFRRAERLARALSSRGVRRNTDDSVLRVESCGLEKTATSSVWNEVNKDLRRTVSEWKGDSKALHNCRKEFATMVCRKYGWEVGEIATGDTVKILQKSYVGKLVIDWRSI